MTDPIDANDLPAIVNLAGTSTNIKYFTLDENEVAEADQTKVTTLAQFDARYTLAGVDNSTPVTLAGTPDYLTLSGQQITLAQIDLTTDVTGALPIANGGSGQATQQAAIDALTAVSAATNEHVLTKDTATGNAVFKAAAGGSSLPVVDETAIVYKTGTPANTLILNVNAFSTARTWAFPDAAATFAGLEVANIYTAAQKINVNSTTALLVEQDGVKDNVFIVDTTNARIGINRVPTLRTIEIEDGAGNRLMDIYKSGSNVVQNFQQPAIFSIAGSVQYNATGSGAFNFGSFLLFDSDVDILFRNDTTTVINMGIDATGNVLIGGGNTGTSISNPGARLYIDQNSATGAIPVLLLDQADDSEEMIEFTATVGTGNAIEAVGVKTLTTTHFIRVTVTGVGYVYIPVGTIA